MAFAAGTRFGVYEITSLIGVGGMGEVYSARDAQLQRGAQGAGSSAGDWFTVGDKEFLIVPNSAGPSPPAPLIVVRAWASALERNAR
jgi:hypothetical protein